MRALYPRLGVLAIGLFLVATNASVIAGVLPELAQDFRVGQDDVGWSITAYAIVVGAASPAVAILLAHWSRTRLMAIGLAIVAIGTAVSACAPDLGVFILGRAIAGLGGAALVPTATASAAALAPPHRRGQAIAVVGIGFALANAAGAPLGTLLAAATDWRVPMAGIAGLAALTIVPLLIFLRHIPLGEAVPMRERIAVLRSAPRLWIIVATVLVLAGFNLLYIFSAAASGYQGEALATLLLVFGVGSVVGNVVAGPLTDRLGARRFGVIAFALQIAAVLGIALLPRGFWLLALLYGVWGAAAFASTIPLQHRMIEVDHRTSGVALSWYGTSTYVGIAIAPPIADGVLGAGEVEMLLPLVAAALTAGSFIGFLLSWARHRRAER